MMSPDRPDPPAPSEAARPRTELAELDTRQLFAGRSEIRIAHRGAIYRLRITRAGKLILNK